MGICASFQEDTDRAFPLLDAGLAWARQQGDTQFSAVLTMHLGSAWLRRGDLTRAEALFDETLAQVQHIRRRLPYPLIGMAGVALRRGDMQLAAQILGAVEAFNIALMPATHPWYNALVTTMHARMGDEAIQRAWTCGQQMSLEEAIAYVREGGLAADVPSQVR